MQIQGLEQARQEAQKTVGIPKSELIELKKKAKELE
jgi:hypothetical protein